MGRLLTGLCPVARLKFESMDIHQPSLWHPGPQGPRPCSPWVSFCCSPPSPPPALAQFTKHAPPAGPLRTQDLCLACSCSLPPQVASRLDLNHCPPLPAAFPAASACPAHLCLPLPVGSLDFTTHFTLFLLGRGEVMGVLGKMLERNLAH